MPGDPTPVRPGLPLWAWRTALLLCMLAILMLSLAPLDVPLPSTGWDKSNHLLGFSTLAVLGWQAFPSRRGVVLAGLLLYGGLIEVLQSFTAYRSAEWGDLLADGIGLLLGAALARWSPAARRMLPAGKAGDRLSGR